MYVRLLTTTPKDFVFTYFFASRRKVNFRPYDPQTQTISKKLAKKINHVSPKLTVYFFGSSSLKISGTGDIDMSVSCPRAQYPYFISKLTSVFGPPSVTKPDFSEWRFREESYPVELVLATSDSRKLADQIEIYNVLKNSPGMLKEYQKLKSDLTSPTEREYYLRRMDFFNRALRASK